jgi:CheY-like chemotaxis protein
MRPKKKILLLAPFEERLSTLRFLLATSGYAVTGVATAPEALELLRQQQFELLLLDLPTPGIDELLDAAHAIDPFMRSLAMCANAGDITRGLCADAIFQRRPTSADLLERVKILCCRKRGPYPQQKPPITAPVILSAEDARVA